MNFAEFKSGPAVSVFAGLGDDWSGLLKHSTSFEDLGNSVAERYAFDRGHFAHAARGYATVCSNGELRLLLAVCAAVDFAPVADDLAAGRAWRDITAGCHRRYRAAIAACVMEAP